MAADDTVIKKMYLSPAKGMEIQDVGLRPFIVSNLINFGFSRGNAQNLEDGRVLVAIEGKESQIKGFKDYLGKRLEAESKKPYSLIPPSISISDIRDHDNPNPVEIFDLRDLTSSLLLEETSRGVGAITKGFRGLSSRLERLPEILEALSKKL